MKIDVEKYLGKWYEIARIPSKFQSDLTEVTAEYTLVDDGNIKVINSGYLFDNKVSIEGIAKPTNKDDEFKVSFFKGVESEYKILAVVDVPTIGQYSVALVGGGSPDYLWILSRTSHIFDSIFDICIDIAKKKGYNADKLEITK